MDKIWYLFTAQGAQGPYSEDELLTYRAQAQIDDNWFAWCEGMDDWQRLGDLFPEATTSIERTEVRNPGFISALSICQKSQTPVHVRHLFEDLLKATFLVPVQEKPEGMKLGKFDSSGQNFTVIAAQGPDGDSVLQAFTDSTSLMKWRPQGCYSITAPAVELMKMAMQHRADGVFINPASESFFRLYQDDIAILARGQIPSD